MATFLFAWELGGGLGHLVPFVPIAQRLCADGHHVVAAIRELPRAYDVLRDTAVACLQAPVKLGGSVDRIEPLRTFAHVLHNMAFADPDVLRTLAEAWSNLYRFVQPDLILFDHSPTALLAARGLDAKRAVIGNGFCCPPDVSPLPDFRPWHEGGIPERLRREEARVLEHANQVLSSWQLASLERLSQLCAQVDDTFLTTFRELDHYPSREEAEYWGVWSNPGGENPEWPRSCGRKVFAYLRPFPGLGKLLELLNQSACSTLVYINPLDPQLRERFESSTLRFEHRRLDVAAVSRECDLAVLHGGHGTTLSMLLAGKPVLLLPLHTEETLTSIAVVRLGAGLAIQSSVSEELPAKVTRFLQSDEYDRCAEAARRFAARYADFDPQRQVHNVVDRLEALVLRS